MFLIVSIVQCQEANNSQRATEPSLDETQKWILQTFTSENAHRSDCQEYTPDLPGVNYGAYTSCFYTDYKNLTFAHCKMSFEIQHGQGGIKEGGPNYSPDDANSTVVLLDLSQIDPTSIKTENLRGTFGKLDKKTFYPNPATMIDVRFGTTNDLNSIVVTYPHASYSKDHPEEVHSCCGLGDAGITLEPNYAPRFVKAFRHAIDLCGGKPSTF